MYPNLNAEQARYGHSDSYVANQLGISRSGYGAKKKTGKFITPEIKKLCSLYGADFNYLFESANQKY